MKHILTAIISDKRGMPLSVGKNSYVKTHPLQAMYAERMGAKDRVFLHAEIDAIIRCKDLSKAHSMLITRVRKNGTFGLAKPCTICVEAIRNTPIQSVRYSDG